MGQQILQKILKKMGKLFVIRLGSYASGAHVRIYGIYMPLPPTLSLCPDAPIYRERERLLVTLFSLHKRTNSHICPLKLEPGEVWAPPGTLNDLIWAPEVLLFGIILGL